MPPFPLEIALVPLKCSSTNLQFHYRVPFTKKRMPWCPCPFKNEAYSPVGSFRICSTWCICVLLLVLKLLKPYWVIWSILSVLRVGRNVSVSARGHVGKIVIHLQKKKLGLYESPTWIVSKHRFQVSLMQGFPLFFIYQGSDSRFPKITTFCKIKTTTERVCFTLY